GERGFLHVVEDRAEVVLDPTHDEAIEQRHLTPAAGACDDPARWQEPEVSQCFVVAVRPLLPRFPTALLDRSGCPRYSAPSILQRAVDRLAVSCFQAIFLLPNELRDGADAERIWMHAVLRDPARLVPSIAR